MTPEHQRIIDQTLEEVAQTESERALAISNTPISQPNKEALRQSSLGQRLTTLAEIAEQGLIVSPQEARAALESVYAILLKGPLLAFPLIPPAFDRTPLGQLLNQARSRILSLNDVVTISEASRLSGLSRVTLYALINGGLLHPIEMNKRTMIERQELERVKSVKGEDTPTS